MADDGFSALASFFALAEAVDAVFLAFEETLKAFVALAELDFGSFAGAAFAVLVVLGSLGGGGGGVSFLALEDEVFSAFASAL